MGIFDNAVSVVIGNKIVDSITTSDNGVIYERTEHTRLSIDVPLNLTYSDAFSITGHLTTANGTGISGEEVVLKVDGSVMDSTTTTNNGAYSFTQTPVSTGNHNFQVAYAGSNSYGSSESSTVTRDINKETSVLTATLNKTKYDIGDTIVITAHLTDDEGNEITDAQEISRLKVNYDGAWHTISLLDFMNENKIYVPCDDGINSVLQVKHGESLYYTESSINIPLNMVTPTLISTSSSNQIIGDGDSTTVTAKLMDQDGDAIPNRTLSYVVKHGNDTLDSGSDTTDSNGEIDISYTGTAVGQVDVVVSYGMLLQETYELLDCIAIDNATDSDHNDSIWSAVNRFNRGTDYTTFTHTALATTYVEISDNNCIEFDIQSDTNYSNSNLLSIRRDNTVLLQTTRGSLNISENDFSHIKIEIKDNQCIITNTDNDRSVTGDVTGYNRFYFRIGANETIYFKNLKVYSL